MLLKHYFLEKIAHSSYILAGKQTCAVIDPRRDVDLYINEARSALLMCQLPSVKNLLLWKRNMDNIAMTRNQST